MKKRIISGVVMGVIVVLVLVLGLNVSNLIINVFIAIIAALGALELVCNAARVDNIIFKILVGVYTAAMVLIMTRWLDQVLGMSVTLRGNASAIEIDTSDVYMPMIAAMVTVVYFIVCAVLILVKQADFDLAKIATLVSMPMLLAFAFSTIGSIVTAYNGIYYLLLVLNFSCVCDMGAYFVGVSMGKTKLCPEISPKKTVEGSLGGIVSSVIVTLIITLCFGYFDKILPTLLLTIPLCVAGMAGDLFASIIKRKVGIKDYGDLIPGHGGILDRVDSILFISPLVFCLLFLGAI
ncbi:MAG: phosphatidate cytidylyltransferase [Clostridia bacterium]|nr:phosphatidate cytidylyltransferase [Clostridia bacterium]